MIPQIRGVIVEDIVSIKGVLDTIDLFPSEILDDMILDYFDNPETQDIWFTATIDDEPVAIGYCGPEQLAVGTFNLHAIGVKSDIQGKGVGEKMMTYLEEYLIGQEARILIVETSGSDDFTLIRKFYKNLGYSKEAVIRDFWGEGDDKVVYWKKMI